MMSIINNKLGKLIIENKDLMIKWFDYNSTVPDEHCYITLVYWLNLQDEIITTPNTSYSGATTFAPWDDMIDYKVYKDSIKINSYTYIHISKKEIDDLIKGKCLFGRKFNPDSKVIKNKNSFDNAYSLTQYLTKKNIISTVKA
jgi:hypothetical protein